MSPSTTTVTVKASATAYVWVTVTSPATAADGDYRVVATVARTGSEPVSSFTSYYKVYSSDSTGPTLFWQNPDDGSTISGRTYNLSVSTRDDHAVREVHLYVDGKPLSTTTCDNIAYTCQLNHSWSTSTGTHVATFVARDWLDNESTRTVNFTVN